MNNTINHSRRRLLKTTAATGLGASLIPSSLFAEGAVDPKTLEIYRTKAMGCFVGAAIADAMGGPTECQHYLRIAEMFPDFQNHIRYDTPGTFFKLRPGYALDAAAGSITDDTFIRMDLAGYLLGTDVPYDAASFAPWLLQHADFSNWWKVAVRPLKRIEKGEVAPEEAGVDHKQGGGGGWWQPVSMLYAGDPQKASAVTTAMCKIWKAPLEEDILSSVVAGQAAAYKKGATVDSVVQAVLDDSGELTKKLFTRAVEIAQKAKSPTELYEELYKHCLVKSCTTDVDGPMPERLEPEVRMEPKGYNGILFAEQQPLALAYFVYGQGDPYKTVLTGVKGGRDADSITCNSAAWLGALSGMEVWPKKWVDVVQNANLKRMNLLKTGNELIEKGIANKTVRFDRMGWGDRLAAC
ncbi:ADP-ribosylglycohydrolase family protein [Novipirellula artificiosorum]|uniref:ADP-ribosylglycohydrolase n=1 Tax=Novipirellula artificiosorum TaxID=2528016 RepID=A0A5C6D8M0_9BACT|nr:ADP-ribosylglycohydrolase family protein [Novipirellula artificiosorum]TWU33190.1 ADP-ribosylglycohydrolase [Novipirellula artificiosorum]